MLQGQESFHHEKDDLLQAGLTAYSYVTVDDSSARHQGKNGFVAHIGNDLFGWFQSTGSKRPINFLQLLRVGKADYVLSEATLLYMKKQKLPEKLLAQLTALVAKSFASKDEWVSLLGQLLITHQRIVSEGALLGSVLQRGQCDDLIIVSDDAEQFNILHHALCWVHSERLIHKMLPLNETHRQEIKVIRGQI